MENINVKRGEIYLINLESKGASSIQSGQRPCVIISNEKCNQYSPVVTVVPLTSKVKRMMPTHVSLGIESGLKQDSIFLGEQIMTISKSQIDFKVGECTNYKMKQIEKAIRIQTDLNGKINMKIVEEKLFSIKKLKELFLITNNEDLNKMFNIGLEDFKRYCDSFGKNYLQFYNDNNDIINKNTQILKVV